MADETKAVDEFMAGLSNDGSKNPLEDSQADPFKATEEEKKETTEEPVEKEEVKEEKPFPFHQDPKVQRFIDKKVAEAIASRTYEPEKEESKETENPYGDILKEIIGDDTPEKRNAIDKFNRTFVEREERIANRSQEIINAERQAEIQAEADAENTLLNGFDAIEEQYGVDITSNTPLARKQRGEFIDFIRKVAPKDEQGEIADFPDFVGTFETFQSLKKEPNSTNRAKELASRSSERGSSSEGIKPIQGNLEYEFEKFKDSIR